MSKAYDISIKYKTYLESKGINTPKRKAYFLARCYAESKLIPQRESLYYTTVAKARAAFKSPFANKTDDFVAGYLKDSVKMANYVSANRMGNGDEKSGDGYKFRGGGFLQNTGKNEMKILTARTGVDFYSNPDLLKEEVNALVAAVDYWNRLGLSYYADRDDLDTICDLINMGKKTAKMGDANGYAETLQYYNSIKKEFKV